MHPSLSYIELSSLERLTICLPILHLNELSEHLTCSITKGAERSRC